MDLCTVRATALWGCLIAMSFQGLAAAQTVETLPRFHAGNVGDLITFEIVYTGSMYTAGFYDVVYDATQLQPVAFEQDEYLFPQFFPRTRKQDGRILFMGVVNFFGPVPSGPIGSVTFRKIGAGASAVRPVPTLDEFYQWSADLGVSRQPDYMGSLVVSPGFVYPQLQRVEPVSFETTGLFETSFETARFRNGGTGPLNVSSIEIVQDSPLYPPDDFQIVADQCSGQVLPAGGECAVTLAFSPQQFTASRDSRALLRLASDDLLLPELDVSISGPIATPLLEIDSFTFYNALQVPPFQRRTLRAVNVGGAQAHTSVFRLRSQTSRDRRTGSPSAYTVTQENCSNRVIDAGEYCEFEIEFRPYSDGGFIDQVMLFYNAYHEFQYIFGYTPTGLPVLEYDGPAEITLPLGQSELRTVRLTNKSTTPLTIEDDQPPAGAAGFTVLSSNCPLRILKFGDFCSVVVRIEPEYVGFHYWNASLDTDSFLAAPVMYLRLQGVEP